MSVVAVLLLFKPCLSYYSRCCQDKSHVQLLPYVSVNSKPDHSPPGDPREFAHSSCPRGRVFAPLSCPRVCPGGLKSKQKFDNFEKSAIFALSLKHLSSSSFHMFIYARSEQRDLVPIYTITNTQRIRNYPGKLRFILVKISSTPGQRKPNFIQVFYNWEFTRTPLFTRVQIWRVFRLVQLWVNAFTRWYKRVGAYLGNLIFIHFFLVIYFYPDWSQSPYCAN